MPSASESLYHDGRLEITSEEIRFDGKSIAKISNIREVLLTENSIGEWGCFWFLLALSWTFACIVAESGWAGPSTSLGVELAKLGEIDEKYFPLIRIGSMVLGPLIMFFHLIEFWLFEKKWTVTFVESEVKSKWTGRVKKTGSTYSSGDAAVAEKVRQVVNSIRPQNSE